MLWSCEIDDLRALRFPQSRRVINTAAWKRVQMPHDFLASLPEGSSFTTIKASDPDSPNAYCPKDMDILYGKLKTSAGQIYVCIVNPGGLKAPLFTLHGGPGMASFYLDPMVCISESREA